MGEFVGQVSAMMRRAQLLPIVAMMVALLAGSVGATYAQTQGGNCEYFNETGHYVCDEFLEFYRTRGALESFGYPLTEAFDDPTRGLRVQYFQRARMERRPNNPNPYKMQLGLLVDELGYQFPPARAGQIPPFNTSLQQYFPETGHVVSYAWMSLAIPVPSSCTRTGTWYSTFSGRAWSGIPRIGRGRACA